MKKTTNDKPTRYARFGKKPSTDKPEHVPILRYGAYSNLATFKQRLVVVGMQKYGNFARLVELDKDYEPDAINQEKFDLDNDPYGVNLDLMKDKIKTRGRLIDKMLYADRHCTRP